MDDDHLRGLAPQTLFLCSRMALSAVSLTLRSVGGLAPRMTCTRAAVAATNVLERDHLARQADRSR